MNYRILPLADKSRALNGIQGLKNIAKYLQEGNVTKADLGKLKEIEKKQRKQELLEFLLVKGTER